MTTVWKVRAITPEGADCTVDRLGAAWFQFYATEEEAVAVAMALQLEQEPGPGRCSFLAVPADPIRDQIAALEAIAGGVDNMRGTVLVYLAGWPKHDPRTRLFLEELAEDLEALMTDTDLLRFEFEQLKDSSCRKGS